MAGKTKAADKVEEVVTLESSPVGDAPNAEQAPESNQPASDPTETAPPAPEQPPAEPEVEPGEEPNAPDTIRVREAGVFVKNGQRHNLEAGQTFLSHDFDLDLLLKQGIQLDVIDEDGDVLLDLNEG